MAVMRMSIGHQRSPKRHVAGGSYRHEFQRRAARGVSTALGLAALVVAAPALAASDSVDVTAGRVLAEKWCAECHVPGSSIRGRPGVPPSFRAIAKDPATTERSVRVFLVSPHPSMPNVSLTREQVDDIVAYILSLKRR
jgi:mono/diheme cytochrome c family protein